LPISAPPLARKYKTALADVGFMDLNSRNEIVYFQAFLDSIYVYDLRGKKLRQARQTLDFRPQLLTEDQQEALNEDVFVDKDDRIFVLRVFKENREQGTFVDTIDEYNPDLKLFRTYKLPNPSRCHRLNFVSPGTTNSPARNPVLVFCITA
jgi:hypothetical protein